MYTVVGKGRTGGVRILCNFMQNWYKLVGIYEGVACIFMKSLPLRRMIEHREKDIEEAFSHVLTTKIRVKLDVETSHHPSPKIDLDRLWKQVLLFVRPPTTQALLKQHGRLVSFYDNTACISLKNSSLLRMLDNRKQEISKAFVHVLDAEIEVKINVENYWYWRRVYHDCLDKTMKDKKHPWCADEIYREKIGSLLPVSSWLVDWVKERNHSKSTLYSWLSSVENKEKNEKIISA